MLSIGSNTLLFRIRCHLFKRSFCLTGHICGSTVKPVSPPSPFSETRKENLDLRKKQKHKKIIYMGATITNLKCPLKNGERGQRSILITTELFLQKCLFVSFCFSILALTLYLLSNKVSLKDYEIGRFYILLE